MKEIDLKLLRSLAEALGETAGDVQKIVIEVGVNEFPKAYVQRVLFDQSSYSVLRVIQDSLGLRVEADDSVQVIDLSK